MLMVNIISLFILISRIEWIVKNSSMFKKMQCSMMFQNYLFEEKKKSPFLLYFIQLGTTLSSS